MRNALSTLALTLFLTACSADDSVDHVEERQLPIIGGTLDTGDPAVVLVIAQNPQTKSASLCTGSVVSPHVVLTAAHCVNPAVVGTGNTFGIFLGNNINDPVQAKLASNFIAAKETHYDTQFDVKQLANGHDIGVVITKKAINVQTLPMNYAPLTQAMKGKTLRLIGYGVNSGSDQTGASAGTKRQVSTPLTDFDSILLAFGNANHNTCEGDSGGPALMVMNGVETIVGITSFGDKGCMKGGVDTRVDYYAQDFVDPYIAANDGTGGPPDLSSPADLSPPAAADMAGTFPFADMSRAPGSVGAACTSHSQCDSKVCAMSGGTGFCTKACDPTSFDSCPTGSYCGMIDGMSYCLPSAGGGGGASGCSVDRRAPAPDAGLLVLVALFGTVALARRRRALAPARR